MIDDQDDGGYGANYDSLEDDLSAYYDGNARGASAFMAEIQQYAADRQSASSTSSRAQAKATKTTTSRASNGKNGSTSSSSTATRSRFGPAPTGSNYRNDFVTGGGGGGGGSGGASDDEGEQFFDAHEYDYFDSDENEPPQAKRRF